MNSQLSRRSGYAVRLLAMTLLASSPSTAQDSATGRLATTSIGDVGQRQDIARTNFGTKPTIRIDSRVQNRIASRIRSRIDRTYTAGLDTLSPYTVARAAIRSNGAQSR